VRRRGAQSDGTRPHARRLRAGIVSKLCVTLVISGAPGLIGLGYLAFYNEADALKARLVDERLADVARARASALQDVLDSAADDVGAMTRLLTVQELGQALMDGNQDEAGRRMPEVMHDLSALVSARPVYLAVRFLGPTGREVARVGSDAGRTSAARDLTGGGSPDPEWPVLRSIPPGQVVESRVMLNRVDGAVESPHRAVTTYAATVRTEDSQQAKGAVTVTVDLTPVLRSVTLAPSWMTVMLVDDQGYCVAHSDPAKAWGGPQDLGTKSSVFRDVPPDVVLLMRQEGGSTASADGVAYAWSHVHPSGGLESHMILVVSAREDALMAPAMSDLRHKMMTLAALSFGLPLLAGVVLISYFMRPVPRLQAAARAVAQGDLKHRVTIKSADEMEDLADDFNYMAERLEGYAQLERTLELEKLRDDLIHMIVHDLRTPLTSVVSSLKTIQKVDCEPELTRELLPYCLTAGKTLMNMINDLLDVHRMEAGRIDLRVEAVNVAAVVDDAVALVRGFATEQGVHIESRVPRSLPTVRADAEKLLRVIVNLLGNGIRFTPSDGRVVVAAEPDGGDGGLHLTVSDTGAGIPEEYRERIFDKFGQVESRKAGKMVSTGLGLTFCKMVTEAHGGRIWVESEVGRGSTFHVVIPATGAADAEAAESPEEAAGDGASDA